MKKKLLIGTGVAAILLVPGLLPGLIVGTVAGSAFMVWVQAETGLSVTKDEDGTIHAVHSNKKEEEE